MDSVTAQSIFLGATAAVSAAYFSHPVAKYLLCFCVFHCCEYGLTKMCSPRTLTPQSFLLVGARGSGHLLAVHVISVAEHAWPVVTCRHYTGFPGLGMAVALGGVAVRAVAMYQCGPSFSHYIETERRAGAVLVTRGIYSWCRHPSYLGFFVYVVGMQVVLGTVVVHVASLAVMVHFFRRRIRFEEWFLVRMYGARYSQYQNEVACLVPYLW